MLYLLIAHHTEGAAAALVASILERDIRNNKENTNV